MMKKYLAYTALIAVLSIGIGVFAADHADGPLASADPAADITDVYAWMSFDTDDLRLIMNVGPFGSATEFSDAVRYVFHINSSATFGAAQTETLIICEFDEVDEELEIECEVEGTDTSVQGDASSPAGISSGDGMLKVFAGSREDPFFFELGGFNKVVETVAGAAGGLTFNASGCPDTTVETAPKSGVEVHELLVDQLTTNNGDELSEPVDDFAGANILSLILEVDKTLVNSGGPILGIWGSTHAR